MFLSPLNILFHNTKGVLKSLNKLDSLTAMIDSKAK